MINKRHYILCKIQPVDFIKANGLSFNAGNVVKYLSRFKDKNGNVDIEKAIEYLTFMHCSNQPTEIITVDEYLNANNIDCDVAEVIRTVSKLYTNNDLKESINLLTNKIKRG